MVVCYQLTCGNYIPLKMITCKDTDPRTVVLLLLAVHKHGVRSVREEGEAYAACVASELTCALFMISPVLQRQAEKKADEQRRRRERKRKKTGPVEVCMPTYKHTFVF